MDTLQERLNPGLRARTLLSRMEARHPVPLRALVEAAQDGPPVTLLCVCPVTPGVVQAAIRVAGELDFPLVFAATLNQVGTDGGYTGWTPATFVQFVGQQVRRVGLQVPVLVGLDHGGPWCRDSAQAHPPDVALRQAEHAIEVCLLAGYTHLHIDATLDATRPDGAALPADVLTRTAALVAHAEAFRLRQSLPPVSYEVSAERESGGHLDASAVEGFVAHLRERLDPALPTPLFTVANVGTDLLSPAFDAAHARTLVHRMAAHGTFLKGHFTDFVSDLDRYPAVGVAAANVGPELAAAEYGRLHLLALTARNRNRDVQFEQTIVQSLEEDGRWRKWLLPGERAEKLRHLPEARQRQIVETASRYVLGTPRVARLRERLYGVAGGAEEAERFVQDELARTLRRYAQAFGLEGLGARLLGVR